MPRAWTRPACISAISIGFDFKVDVSPLVGFDTIVSGLFGNLITKNGKILTTTFRVRGLYESPDVAWNPSSNSAPNSRTTLPGPSPRKLLTIRLRIEGIRVP